MKMDIMGLGAPGANTANSTILAKTLPGELLVVNYQRQAVLEAKERLH